MTFPEIESLANGLLDIHELYDWQFAFNNRKRSLGLCSHAKKTIYISKAFAVGMKPEDINDTLLHEIAHALVGAGHGHDLVWYNQAIAIGCKGATTGKDKETPDEISRGAKWVMVCPRNKIIKTWFRKPQPQTFAKLPFTWARDRKDETYGKLKIITVEEYKKL